MAIIKNLNIDEAFRETSSEKTSTNQRKNINRPVII